MSSKRSNPEIQDKDNGNDNDDELTDSGSNPILNESSGSWGAPSIPTSVPLPSGFSIPPSNSSSPPSGQMLFGPSPSSGSSCTPVSRVSFRVPPSKPSKPASTSKRVCNPQSPTCRSLDFEEEEESESESKNKRPIEPTPILARDSTVDYVVVAYSVLDQGDNNDSGPFYFKIDAHELNDEQKMWLLTLHTWNLAGESSQDCSDVCQSMYPDDIVYLRLMTWFSGFPKVTRTLKLSGYECLFVSFCEWGITNERAQEVLDEYPRKKESEKEGEEI